MKEWITPKQAASVLFAATVSEALIGGVGIERTAGGWAALLAGGAVICFVLAFCILPLKERREETIPSFFCRRFGRMVGKGLCGLTAVAAVLYGTITTGLFSAFVTTTSFEKTSRLIAGGALVLVAAAGAFFGAVRVGRLSQLGFPAIFCLAALSFALSVGQFSGREWTADGGISAFLYGAGAAAAETVTPMFLSVFAISLAPRAKDAGNGHFFRRGILYFAMAVAVMAAMAMRNVQVLGEKMAGEMLFPSYAASGIIGAGEFIQRAEATVAAAFLGASVIRLAVCILAAGGGFAAVFGGSMRKWTAAAAVLNWTISTVGFRGADEYFWFAQAAYAWTWPIAAGLALAVGIGFLWGLKREKSVPPAA